MNPKLSILFRMTVLSLGLLIFVACGSGETAPKHIPSTEHGISAAYNSAYVCPMHCTGSGSEKAGICPGCGMNYVELSEHTKNGHSH